jgi:ubiquitin-activating enzyme E1
VAFDPISCGPVRALPEGWSRWERIVCREGNLTCAQFEAWLARTYSVQVNMITSGKAILYNPMLFKSHREQRAGRPLKDLLEEITHTRVAGRRYVMLDVSVFDDASDVLMPPVQLYFA